MPVLHHGLDLLPTDWQLSLQRRDRSACDLRIGGCTEERLYTDVVGNRGYALDAACCDLCPILRQITIHKAAQGDLAAIDLDGDVSFIHVGAPAQLRLDVPLDLGIRSHGSSDVRLHFAIAR